MHPGDVGSGLVAALENAVCPDSDIVFVVAFGS